MKKTTNNLKKATVFALALACMLGKVIAPVSTKAEEVNTEVTDETLAGSAISNEKADIYIASLDANGFTAGLVLDPTATGNLEYRWLAYNEATGTWSTVQDWTAGNEWLNWKPDTYGKYVVQAEAREVGTTDSVSASTGITYHPNIIGKCQMPYTGEGGGYLIGVESADNQDYSYELLVLDCTKLAANDPAPWIYSSGQQKVSGNAFWTVWQPQYGYYWTLFRVYDANGNLIDEDCYGFENTQPEQTTTNADTNASTTTTTTSNVDAEQLAAAIAQFESAPAGHSLANIDNAQENYIWLCNNTENKWKISSKAGLKAYNYAIANGLDYNKAQTYANNIVNATTDRNQDEEAVIRDFGLDWLRGDLWTLGLVD